jgi:hypothetical protein
MRTQRTRIADESSFPESWLDYSVGKDREGNSAAVDAIAAQTAKAYG